jgi:drug/metabolite transporter (DMT)-like permease
MFDKLGVVGVAGIVVSLAGIGLVAWQNLILAGGLALVVGGLGLVVYGLVTSLLSSLGMGGQMP